MSARKLKTRPSPGEDFVPVGRSHHPSYMINGMHDLDVATTAKHQLTVGLLFAQGEINRLEQEGKLRVLHSTKTDQGGQTTFLVCKGPGGHSAVAELDVLMRQKLSSCKSLHISISAVTDITETFRTSDEWPAIKVLRILTNEARAAEAVAARQALVFRLFLLLLLTVLLGGFLLFSFGGPPSEVHSGNPNPQTLNQQQQ